MDDNHSDNKLKYALEWGDEDIQLSSEDILDSEFFEYMKPKMNSDKFTVKKLMQYIVNLM